MTPTITAPARQPAQGHCNVCRRIWVLDERQGICQWCGNSASCQSTMAKPRRLHSRRNRRPRQDHNGADGYDQLPEQHGWVATDNGFRWASLDYASFARVAMRFAPKAKTGEKEDLLHSIIEGLAAIAIRKATTGQEFSEAAMHRTAEHLKDRYWHTYYAYTNGLDCRNCTKAQRDRCRYNWAHSEWAYCDCHRAIRLESINQPITDEEGNLTELADLIADDRALDLEAWADARTFLIGAPIRLKIIASKRHNGDKLTKAEHDYLYRLRQRYQKILV